VAKGGIALTVAATIAFTVISTAKTPSSPDAYRSSGGAPSSEVRTTQWAGYFVTPGRVTSVTAIWNAPRLACSGIETLSSTWAGVGGLAGGPLLQAGLYGNCLGGLAEIGAFAEEYPGATVSLQFFVRPGDTIRTSIAESSGTWRATVSDLTTGQSGTWRPPGYPGGGSGEWLAEAYGAPGGVPVSNFGSERLRSFLVNRQAARFRESDVYWTTHIRASNPASGVFRLTYVSKV
jgi:hypothetical protein